MQLQPKRPHIDSFSQGDQVYCLNKGDGDYILSIDLRNGKTDTAFIPRTFIPVELTAYTSVEGLQNSQDVRHAIRKEAIILLHKEEAEKMLASDDAKIEIQNLVNKNKEFRVNDDIIVDDINPADALVNKDDTVSMKVKSILLDQDRTEQVKLNDLVRESNLSALSKDDYEYIAIVSKDSKIQTWANKKLKQLNKNN